MLSIKNFDKLKGQILWGEYNSGSVEQYEVIEARESNHRYTINLVNPNQKCQFHLFKNPYNGQYRIWFMKGKERPIKYKISFDRIVDFEGFCSYLNEMLYGTYK